MTRSGAGSLHATAPFATYLAGGPGCRSHLDASNHDIYDAAMRTTIDLDPDVDARLRALARERGVPLRTVINDALRAGTRPDAVDDEPYVLPSRRLGARAGLNLDKALLIASELEDEEVARKLELRK
jgi:hypothetical protein